MVQTPTSNCSELIVAEAKTWLGTPWHHAADIKGRGVDCAMLLVRVFVDTGILEPFDPRPYPMDWFMHSKAEAFQGWIARFGEKIPDGALPQLGDVALFKEGQSASHAGIVVGPDLMIHASRRDRRVEYCEIRALANQCVGFWRVRG